MNLNENLIRRGTKKRKNLKTANCNLHMGPSQSANTTNKRDSTPSSYINWGKKNASVSPGITSIAGTSKGSVSDQDSRVIIAITEGRGNARCEIGMATLNVYRPNLILCQISDTQSYHNALTKINIFEPTEILVPTTFIEKSNNRLIEKIKKKFPNITITGLSRSTFSKAYGIDRIQKLCISDHKDILLVLQHKYYALAAAAALLTYIQERLCVYYTPNTINVEYQESEGHALIDVSTADVLELVACAQPAQATKYSSLFGILNRCVTKVGARTLRSAILKPLFKIDLINERLNCISHLHKNSEMLISIQTILQKVPNIDQLLSITTLRPEGENNRLLNYVLLLNDVLDIITPLKDILSTAKQKTFVEFVNLLNSDDFNTIKSALRNTIHSDAHQVKGNAAVMQRCFAIKTGVNGLLDLIRKTFSERLDDMKVYVDMLAQKYALPLRLNNNNTKGYHIVLTLNSQQKRFMKKSELPPEFIQVYRLAGSFTMKTPELINFSTRIDGIMSDILQISNVMIGSIIKNLKKYIGLFYKLVDGIAYLDMLQSLADSTIGPNYVRPKFSDYTEVTFAHHPLLDYILPSKPVSNPINCCESFNMHIITGPNGSGKSIYIRQVLLLQLMAQIGCYVPAHSATFRPADKMFARMYLEDNMECGASAFVLEMREMKYIMNTMTDNSLIIIDELCRSTSLEEGTALAMAICEKLAQSSAFIYVTTHYTLLTKLSDMNCNIKSFQMETYDNMEQSRKLDFKYSIIPGVTSIKRYGLYLVENIWSDDIVQEIHKILDSIHKPIQGTHICGTIDPKLRLKYETEAKLKKLKSQKKLTQVQVTTIINEYHNELHKLDYDLNISEANTNDLHHDDILPPESFPDLNISENYRNVSMFLQEDSENINLLEPEVEINCSEFVKPSSYVNFSSQLKRCEAITSTPITQQFRCNLTSETNEEINKELEIFSQAITEGSVEMNDNDFPELRLNELQISGNNNNNSNAVIENQRRGGHYEFYVSPIVKIIEGPNDESVSVDLEESQILNPIHVEISENENEINQLIEDDQSENKNQSTKESSSYKIVSKENWQFGNSTEKSISSELTKNCEKANTNLVNESPQINESGGTNECPNITHYTSSKRSNDIVDRCSEVTKSSKENSTITTTTKEENLSSPKTTESSKLIQNDSDQTKLTKSSDSKKSTQRKRRATFKPPRKLTKREIKEEFSAQDSEFFQNNCTINSPGLTKYLTQVINRPSVEQMQNAKHLVLARKTKNGVEVFKAEPPKKRTKKGFPLIRTRSDRAVDVTIFSDKNAKTFEEFINSTEKDYRKFNFNLPSQTSKDVKFSFQPVEKSSTNNIFLNTKSDCFSQTFAQAQAACLQKGGYYEENRHDIKRIVGKYLVPESSHFPTSIFETAEDDDDLEL